MRSCSGDDSSGFAVSWIRTSGFPVLDSTSTVCFSTSEVFSSDHKVTMAFRIVSSIIGHSNYVSGHRSPRNSSTVSPASLIIAPRVPLASSRRLGTVNRLCGAFLCLNIMWLPVWWSSSHPIFARALTTSTPETTGSLGTYFDRFFFDRRWDGFVMLFQTCKVTLNSVFYID